MNKWGSTPYNVLDVQNTTICVFNMAYAIKIACLFPSRPVYSAVNFYNSF